MEMDSEEYVPEPNLGVQHGAAIPSTCLEEARQVLAAGGGPDELDELAGRYGVDPEDLGYAVEAEDLTDEAHSVAGDAQDPMPEDPPRTEFSHGGRYYRVTATDTQYPVLEVKARRDGGGWTEVDPTEDLALYDAFVSAAESIGAMDAPTERVTK